MDMNYMNNIAVFWFTEKDFKVSRSALVVASTNVINLT